MSGILNIFLSLAGAFAADPAEVTDPVVADPGECDSILDSSFVDQVFAQYDFNTSQMGLPVWRPDANCGLNSFAPYPRMYGDPWIFTKINNPIFSKIESRLVGATNVFERAAIITQEVKRSLTWKWQQVPSGKSPDRLLSRPVGNCVDATNFLLAMFRYFKIPAHAVEVTETDDGFTDHVCVSVSPEVGADECAEEVLYDLTRTPAVDVPHREWLPLEDRAFAAIVYNARGVALKESSQPQEAHQQFEMAEEICPQIPYARVNNASYYLTEGEFDIDAAEVRIKSLVDEGYDSTGMRSLLKLYFSNIGQAEFAQKIFPE